MPSTTSDWIVSGSGSSTTSANNIIWTAWNSGITATTVNDPWPIWIADGTTSGSTTSTTPNTIEVWSGWIRDHEAREINDQARRLREASSEEVRQAQERARQRRVQAEGEKKAARERAELLLRENLSDEQIAELADKGYFTLQSIQKDGSRKHYRIKRGYMQNIHEIEPESGRILNTICAHPRMRVPDADAMLVQKFMLESEGHDEFLRVANINRHH